MESHKLPKCHVMRIMGLCLGAGLLAACAHQTQPSANNGKADADADGETLMALDREFCEATRARGAAGWAEYFAKFGVMGGKNEPPAVGRDAIAKAIAPALAQPGSSLVWVPAQGGSWIQGVLGFTTGSFTYTHVNAQGRTAAEHGTYLTIWRRQPDGAWKVVFDTGDP